MTTTAQRDQEAMWAQGQKAKQQRRVWAVEAIKDEMTPAEMEHMKRAVKDTKALFDGQRMEFSGTVVDFGRSSDFGQAARVSAAKRLAILKLCAVVDTRDPRCGDQADRLPGVVEMLMRMATLPEIAARFGCWRSRGADRPLEPDARKIRPLVQDAVTSIAACYEKGTQARGWVNGQYGPLDDLDLNRRKAVSL